MGRTKKVTPEATELRLVDVAFTYQFTEPDTGEHRQWVVHAGKVQGEVRLTVTIHGQGDFIEGLGADTIAAIGDSIQISRDKIAGTQIHEQTS